MKKLNLNQNQSKKMTSTTKINNMTNMVVEIIKEVAATEEAIMVEAAIKVDIEEKEATMVDKEVKDIMVEDTKEKKDNMTIIMMKVATRIMI